MMSKLRYVVQAHSNVDGWQDTRNQSETLAGAMAAQDRLLADNQAWMPGERRARIWDRAEGVTCTPETAGVQWQTVKRKTFEDRPPTASPSRYTPSDLKGMAQRIAKDNGGKLLVWTLEVHNGGARLVAAYSIKTNPLSQTASVAL